MHLDEISKYVDKSIKIILSPIFPIIFHDCDEIMINHSYGVNKSLVVKYFQNLVIVKA